MEQLMLDELEVAKNQIKEIIKPYQQEQNRRQKKADFLTKCIRCAEKNDFFQLDELLKSKLAKDILEDTQHFAECKSIFNDLQEFANVQINQYSVEFKSALLQLAKESGLPLEVDLPRFSALKGIDGSLDFAKRNTTINQVTLKSIDPKRIISTVTKIKRQLYDTPFEPQKFIDSLLDCYKKIAGKGEGVSVAIRQLYNNYVWSLQSQVFFQNMDKGKFKGYSVDQFAVDLWRFFASDVSSTSGGYRIRLNSGRGKSLWLIDQEGQRRHITQLSFVKK